jgi:hypothetical protein
MTNLGLIYTLRREAENFNVIVSKGVLPVKPGTYPPSRSSLPFFLSTS